MRICAALLLLCAACDVVLGLEVAPEAASPSEHDEDNDEVADSLDLCPHIFEAEQVDSDTDGVGDACDDAATSQRWVLFKSMVDTMGISMSSDTGGTWKQVEDAWRYDGKSPTGGGNMMIELPIENTDVYVGFTIHTPREPPRQISVAITRMLPLPPPNDVAIYGELYEADGLMPFAAVKSLSGMTATTLDEQPLAMGIETAKLATRLRARGASVQPSGISFTAKFATPTPEYAVMDPQTHPSGDRLSIYVQRIEIDIDYIAIIATDP